MLKTSYAVLRQLLFLLYNVITIIISNLEKIRADNSHKLSNLIFSKKIEKNKIFQNGVCFI